jgi:hypothetical protein
MGPVQMYLTPLAIALWRYQAVPANKKALSPPEVFERRRAQLRVARRVLDRSVAEPILDASRVVAGVRQGVAAGVACLSVDSR